MTTKKDDVARKAAEDQKKADQANIDLDNQRKQLQKEQEDLEAAKKAFDEQEKHRTA